jgi:hypothetical protein
MRPVEKIPEYGPLPISKEDREEFLNRFVRDTSTFLSRTKEILEGKVSIATDNSEDIEANVDAATVDVFWTSTANLLVDNPLGREPIGCILVDQGGDVFIHHTYTNFSSRISVTASSTAVTDTSSGFTTSMEGGYLIAASQRVKIATYSSAATMTLKSPWPGSTLSSITAIVQHKWDEEAIAITASLSPTSSAWARLLVF